MEQISQLYMQTGKYTKERMNALVPSVESCLRLELNTEEINKVINEENSNLDAMYVTFRGNI